MNSSTDNDFDAKLDGLLKDSVSPGAEPPGFAIVRPPHRPRFSWSLFGGAVTVLALAGALMVFWISGSPAEKESVSPVPGRDLWTFLSECITLGVERLTSPDILIYTAITMAMVYYYLASRSIRFFRLH